MECSIGGRALPDDVSGAPTLVTSRRPGWVPGGPWIVGTTTNRQLAGRYGALKSWGRTVDRSARTRAGRAAGPASVEYHLERLPEQFACATDAQRLAAAEAARKAWYAELAMKSAASRAAKRASRLVAAYPLAAITTQNA